MLVFMAEDKTSSGLLSLVISALRAEAPELLPEKAVMPDCAFAVASASLKRELLERALAARGPAFILAMGQGIKQTGFEPLLYVLLQSETPSILFAKWQRFEQYTHSRHRTALVAETETSLKLRRFGQSGPPPEKCENLLIAGLLVALIEEIGGTDLRLVWGKGGEGAAEVTVNWSGFGQRRRLPRVPRAVSQPRAPLVHYGVDERSPTARRVVRLVAGDVGRDWPLAELGGRLSLSPRSLQRRLAEENTSLSAIIRAVRIREACQLLSESSMTLTEIGYWCGFSDSPHFSREFRRALAMPPSVYRQSAA